MFSGVRIPFLKYFLYLEVIYMVKAFINVVYSQNLGLCLAINGHAIVSYEIWMKNRCMHS